MVLCPKCYAGNPDSAKTCHWCGELLKATEAAESAHHEQSEESPDTEVDGPKAIERFEAEHRRAVTLRGLSYVVTGIFILAEIIMVVIVLGGDGGNMEIGKLDWIGIGTIAGMILSNVIVYQVLHGIADALDALITNQNILGALWVGQNKNKK